MAIIAITTSNSISVKALARSHSFGRVDAEQVLFDFTDKRCGSISQISTQLVNNYFTFLGSGDPS